jgi:hypothetical protein
MELLLKSRKMTVRTKGINLKMFGVIPHTNIEYTQNSKHGQITVDYT